MKNAYLHGGTRYDHFQKTFLKYCPTCFDEDVKKAGEPYFHTMHQLDGILLCPKCYTQLKKYLSEDIYSYIYLDKSNIKGDKNFIIPKIHKDLAKMALEILTQKYIFKDHKGLRDRIYKLLKERNAIFNKIICMDFINEIEQTYRIDIDAATYFGFDINKICEEIPKILSQSDRNKVKTITYLVLIHYLTCSLDSFLKTKPYNYKKSNTKYRWDSIELLTKHKNIIETAIKEENITRSELRSRYKASYSFLIQADKEWLTNKLPLPSRQATYDAHFDRDTRDLVEKTYKNILSEGKRVTKANLLEMMR